MVVAQLAGRSLPIPDVRVSHPVIGKILKTTCHVYLLTAEKTKIKKKKNVREWPLMMGGGGLMPEDPSSHGAL